MAKVILFTDESNITANQTQEMAFGENIIIEYLLPGLKTKA